MDTQILHAEDTLTPMMRQYRKIKETLPDTILLFRLGDFYEMFFEDAKRASSVLNIALTGRDAGKLGRAPMCGVPYHAAEAYISRLIKAGNKVAICDQTEDARLAKGLVKREVTRVITPGTVLDANMLPDKANNYFASVYKTGDLLGLSFVDLSTGEFKATQLNDERELLTEIVRIRPSEIILPKKYAAEKNLIDKIKSACCPLFNYLDDWTFDYETCGNVLREQFKVASLDGFGLKDMAPAVIAAGAVISYLRNNLYESLSHIGGVTVYSTSGFMILDSISQRNLELTGTLRAGSKEGTLLHVIDKTATPMGGRLIRDWILCPLTSIGKIRERQGAVETFIESKSGLYGVIEIMREVKDIERIVGRLNCGVGNPRDLLSLRSSLSAVPLMKAALKDHNDPFIKALRESLDEMRDIHDLIGCSIGDDAPISVREGNIIKEGYSAELDEIRSIFKNARGWIAELQNREIQRTGIKSLKVRYNKVFGYYIEISNTNLASAPADYIRRQTLVNCERFVTEELKDHETKVLGAEERSNAREYELFTQIKDKVIAGTQRLQNLSFSIAVLDVLCSFAMASVENNYVKPVVDDSDAINISGGRHPVVETLIGGNKFVPNDLLLDLSDNQLLIITGPNMAGKSTYIRQAALIVLMAQTGMFVPADKARIGVVDRIFTRVGASDDIASGQSTFMVEMAETANIINNATCRSLIILDEIGRGTSTFDGLSIAWAVCEYLHNTEKKKARTLFATHYHELTELELTMGGVKNYNIAVREWNDDVIFLRKIVRGASDKSYGIHVGKLAGLPQEIIQRAMEILDNLEEGSLTETGKPALAKSKVKKAAGEEQFLFFQNKKNPVLEELEKIDIDNLTPVQALNKLMELKKM